MKGKSFLFVVFLLVLTFTMASAQVVDLGKGFDSVSVIVERSDDMSTVVRFELGSFEKTAVETEKGTYFKISCSNEELLTNKGEPELPQLVRNIIIPDDQEVEIKVLSSEYQDFQGVPVAPSKGLIPRSADPDTIPYTFGPVYESDSWYPSKLVELTDPFILRDIRGITIKLNAFQYNPKTRALRVYTKVTVEARAVGPGKVNVLKQTEKPRNRVKAFEDIYRSQFINYSLQQPKGGLAQEAGDMLIITRDGFHNKMMEFAEWKKQKGIKTTVVDASTIGNDTTLIRDFVKSFYESTNLAWLLLAGDVDSIPTPIALGAAGSDRGPADPVYSLISGDDNYPEIFVGRFSAESHNDIGTQVGRSIGYEHLGAGASWLHRGTCVASLTEQDIPKARYIAQVLKYPSFTYTQVDTLFPGAAHSESTVFEMLSDSLNLGRGIVSFAGHGNQYAWSLSSFGPQFTSANVDALANDWMLPFIYSTACDVGEIDWDKPCFAEHWMRLTFKGIPRGAIATYMSSTGSYYANNDGMARSLVSDSITTIGALCFNSLLNHPNFKTHIIFGDPSLQLRTDAPQQLIINHSAVLNANQPQYEVEVEDSIEGVSVKDALCALYRDGVLYGSAYTNSSGMATIPIAGLLPEDDSLLLTVTAFNKVTHVDKVALSNFPPQNFHVKTWTDSTVTLAWTSKGSQNSLGYNIYRDTLSGGSGVKINLGGLIPQPDSQYQDTGLEFNKTYYYAITNIDTSGQESYPSLEVRISIGQGSAPTGLAVQREGCDIRLYWSSNLEEDILKYRIYGQAPRDTAYVLLDSTADTTYLDTNITKAGVHSYEITSVNNLGLESYPSIPAWVNFKVEVLPPDSLKVSSWLGTRVTLTWKDGQGSGGQPHNIYRSTVSGRFSDSPLNTSPVTSHTYEDSSLTEGTIYYYAVTTTAGSAQCGVETDFSNQEEFLAGRPRTVTGLNAGYSADSCDIVLSWHPNPEGDITRYRVYHALYGLPFQAKDSILAPETTYVDTSINDALNHYYTVVAIDSLGLESFRPSTVYLKSLAGVLPPPSFHMASWFGTSVTLGWDKPYGMVGGYNIYRSTTPYQFNDPPINGTLITSLSYQDAGLTEGVTYYYIVKSVGQCNGLESGGSNQVDFLAGRPQTPHLEVKNGRHNIRLSMSSSETDIKGYRIFRKEGEYGSFIEINPLCLDTFYVDASAVGGISYQYEITAINTLDLESFPSDPVEGCVMSLNQGTLLVDMTRPYEHYTGVNSDSVNAFYQRTLKNSLGYGYTYLAKDGDTDTLRLIDLSTYSVAIIHSEEKDIWHSLDLRTYQVLRCYARAGGALLIEGRRNLCGREGTSGFRYFDSGDFRYEDLNIDSAFISMQPVNSCDYEGEFIGTNRAPQMEGYPQAVEVDTHRVNTAYEGGGDCSGGSGSKGIDAQGKLTGVGYFFPADPSEVIYTFVSAYPETSSSHGKPVALQHITDSSKVIYFDFPLWFVQESTAVQILGKALETLGAIRYVAGDASGDGLVDIGDVIFLIDYLFRNGSAPAVMEAMDVNGDCEVNIGDVVYLINYLFKGGPAPMLGCASSGGAT